MSNGESSNTGVNCMFCGLAYEAGDKMACLQVVETPGLIQRAPQKSLEVAPIGHLTCTFNALLEMSVAGRTTDDSGSSEAGT